MKIINNGSIINFRKKLKGNDFVDYSVFFELAIIIVAAKTMGILARKINVPQVVGEIIAGLLIGPNVLGLVKPSEFLSYMAELGVIMLMFVAGLETDLKEIKRSGFKALLIAACGVVVPFVLGYLLYSVFYGFAPVGSDKFLEGLFIGTVITATSVGITVEVMRELGKLKSAVGTIVLSAAIIDDVIGIVVLAVVSGLKGSASAAGAVLLRTLLFLVFSAVVAFIGYHLFKWLDKISPHRRRIPIFSLAFCFAMAYLAEHFFGIADITGAYLAGVILCNINDAAYIARRVDINSYMLFSPIFFAGIGIKTDLTGIDAGIIVFGLAFVAVAMAAKVIGCGGMAKLCGFSVSDSLKIGAGMMARGEVALIVAQKGMSAGVIEQRFFAPVIMLIIISSVLTPIVLKLLYRKKEKTEPVGTPAQ